MGGSDGSRNSAQLVSKHKTLAVVLPLTIILAAAAPSHLAGDDSLVRRQGRLTALWGDPRPESGRPGLLRFELDDGGETTLLDVPEALLRRSGGVRIMNGAEVEVAFTRSAFIEQPVTSLTVHSPAASPAVEGNKPFVSLLCKYSDVADEPMTIPYFQEMYDNIPGRLDHYWRAQSYGAISVADSDVSGWKTLPHPKSWYGTDNNFDTSSIFEDCVSVHDPFVDFSRGGTGGYAGINMMFNGDTGCCGWGSKRHTTLDGVTKTWSLTWLPPWGYDDLAIVSHEMGHSFGLPHSDNSDNDNHVYDNPWDIMSASNSYNVMDEIYSERGKHTIALHKDMLGWIPPGEKFHITEPGPYTLSLSNLALPTVGGYRYVTVPHPSAYPTGFYTIEVRRLEGDDYDGALPGNAVIIHDVDDIGPLPARIVDGDVPPADFSDTEGSMWRVGETFHDPVDRVEITVLNSTAEGFDVFVSYEQCDPPLAENEEAVAFIDEEISVDILANDCLHWEYDLSLSLVQGPYHGSADLAGSVVTYRPDSGYSGTDSVTYALTEGGVEIDRASLTVHVVPEFLEVCPSGCDYTGVQQAIAGSRDRQTIVLHPGTYSENVNFSGRAITLRSADPFNSASVESTVLQGSYGSVVTFNSGEGPDSVLRGLTITGGSANQGGGIFIEGAAPTIDRCVLTANSGTYGAAIYTERGESLTITDSFITGNSSSMRGGGIYSTFTPLTITGSVIAGNSASSRAGGIYVFGSRGELTLVGTVISGNSAGDSGAAILASWSPLNLFGTTISGNAAGVSAAVNSYNNPVTIVNSIVRGNSTEDLFVSSPEHPVVVEHSIVGNDWTGGTATLDTDPLFVDPRDPAEAPTPEGNYCLLPLSPAIDAGTGDAASWPMLTEADFEGQGRPQGAARDIGADEHVFRGDWNADGSPDLVWRHSSTGAAYLWYMSGPAFSGGAPLPTMNDPLWTIAAREDFNGDGHPDILWRHAGSGANYLWFMRGPEVTGSAPVPPTDTAYSLEGAGDFDLDGSPDLLWRHTGSGENYIWYMDGSRFKGIAAAPSVAGGWAAGSVIDFNGDGHPDILWRHGESGAVYLWHMEGPEVTEVMALPPASPAWSIVGSADFDGDNRPDICWRNYETGANYIWYMDGGAVTGGAALPRVSDTRWRMR